MSLSIKAARASNPVVQYRAGGSRGDPGLFGTIAKIGGGIIGAVTGGPAGAVAGWKTGGMIGSAIEGPSSPRSMPGTGRGIMPQRPDSVVTRQRGSFGPFRGGSTTTQYFGPQTGPMTTGTVTQEIGCPSGYHPNKSGYWTKSEGYIPKGTKCVKNRRRNPANPRALDRAIGRLNSAKRLQSKMSKYSTDKYTRTGKRKDCKR